MASNGATASTDSDTNLCVITGANPVVIKNRLGAQGTFIITLTYK